MLLMLRLVSLILPSFQTPFDSEGEVAYNSRYPKCHTDPPIIGAKS